MKVTSKLNISTVSELCKWTSKQSSTVLHESGSLTRRILQLVIVGLKLRRGVFRGRCGTFLLTTTSCQLITRVFAACGTVTTRGGRGGGRWGCTFSSWVGVGVIGGRQAFCCFLCVCVCEGCSSKFRISVVYTLHHSQYNRKSLIVISYPNLLIMRFIDISLNKCLTTVKSA